MKTCSTPLPIQEAVRDVLMDLVGRGTAVTKASAKLGKGEEDGLLVVASYRDDHGHVAALALGDVGFAARLGAALSLVPPPVAEESVETGDVFESLMENYREVVNVLARLLNGEAYPHVVLDQVYRVPDDVPATTVLPADVAAALGAPAIRRDFDVTVETYGNGRFSVLVA